MSQLALRASHDAAARMAHPKPTPAQAEAGNYRHAHISVHGLPIKIETARGSTRRGVGADGEPWSVVMPAHYGAFKRTKGADGDPVDVYLGKHPMSRRVFVINQLDADTGKFDEHKIMLGYPIKQMAIRDYEKAFSDGKGKDRIGSVVEMSIDEFKERLKQPGAFTKSIKRAAGGRAGFADGGSPQELSPEEAGIAPPIKELSPEEAGIAPVGTSEAIGRGVAHGLSFGFGDELRGLSEAGGTRPDEPAQLTKVIKGAYRKLTGNEDAQKAYTAATERERAANMAAETQHPWAYGSGDVAGSVAGMAALPIGAGAGLAGRAVQGAKLGAVSGALTGAGDTEGGVTDRLKGAAIGAGEGGIGGALSAPVASAVEGAGRLGYNTLIKPAVSIARGLIDPEAEASRRAVGAIGRDIAGGRAGLSPQEHAAALASGEPVANVDLGGTTTRALMRSAANTSTEGRAALEEMTQQRFYSQNERASDLIRDLVATPGNANATREQLIDAARKANGPAYRQAYAAGDRPVWSPELERLAGSPAVIDAMKGAVERGKNRAINDGFGAFNPGVKVTQDGQLAFNTGRNGVPTYPNLQFWDYAQRELRDAASAAQRSGRNEEAGALTGLHRQLVGELDKQVPEFGQARSGAAAFFGGQDALEAGQNAVKWRGDPGVVAQQMAKMKPAERDLFREGYASSWADSVRAMPDNIDVTKRIYNSPQARQMAETILGPQGTQKMEAFLHRESIMDYSRRALGNSTTARQLIEAGLAGGGIGGYLEGGDLSGFVHGAGTGASLAIGAKAGAGKLIGYVDQKTAKAVAEMLASNDPRMLAKGLKFASSNARVRDGLRNLDTRMASSIGARTVPHITVHPLRQLQGPVPAGAQENQQP